MGFSRQEYWSRLPFLSPRDLPSSGIEPKSSALEADSLPLSHLRSIITTVGGKYYYYFHLMDKETEAWSLPNDTPGHILGLDVFVLKDFLGV